MQNKYLENGKEKDRAYRVWDDAFSAEQKAENCCKLQERGPFSPPGLGNRSTVLVHYDPRTDLADMLIDVAIVRYLSSLIQLEALLALRCTPHRDCFQFDRRKECTISPTIPSPLEHMSW